MVTFAAALIESGLPKFHFMLTDSVPTNQLRINQLVRNACFADSEVEALQVPLEKREGRSFWQEALRPYDWILYVTPDGNLNELRNLIWLVKSKRKKIFPAIC